jgi:hypothetical protein
MAAKGGGSSQGLIVTLIFFILATLILGVTTWLGFSGQDELSKAKAEAEKKAKDWETDADWYKFQAVYMRNIAGEKLPKDGEVAGPLKTRWPQLKSATRDTLKEDIGRLVDQYDKNFGWDAQTNLPKTSYKAQLAEKQKENDKLKQDLAASKAEAALARNEAAQATDDLKKSRAVYADELKKQRDNYNNDLTKHQNAVAALQKQVDEINNARTDDKNTAARAAEDAEKERLKLDKDLKSAKTQLEKELEKGEAKKLDVRTPILGKVVAFNGSGSMPFINLGSADGVKPELTFSVCSVDTDGHPVLNNVVGPDDKPVLGQGGKPQKEGKATIEVVSVLEPHLSQARITWWRDGSGRSDPVLKGDVLLNPGWNPNEPTHVAITGFVDLSGLSHDDLQELRRRLDRQNVVIDAYLDVSDMTIKGKGITRETNMLILGADRDPRGGNRRGNEDDANVKKFVELQVQMVDEAVRKGVRIITLRDYLALSGFRVPKSGLNENIGGGRLPAAPAAPAAPPAGADKDAPKADKEKDKDK